MKKRKERKTPTTDKKTKNQYLRNNIRVILHLIILIQILLILFYKYIYLLNKFPVVSFGILFGLSCFHDHVYIFRQRIGSDRQKRHRHRNSMSNIFNITPIRIGFIFSFWPTADKFTALKFNYILFLYIYN